MQPASKEDEDIEKRSTTATGATPAHQSAGIGRRRKQKPDQGYWCGIAEGLSEVSYSRLLRGEVGLLERIERNSDAICSENLAEIVFSEVGRVTVDLPGVWETQKC